MINAIFFDADNTLIYSDLDQPNQKHLRVVLENGGIYYTMVRPCAKRLIDYARLLIGHKNVYILTAATKDYASEISRLAEWGFPETHILAREDMEANYYATAYGGHTITPSQYASLDNVLIDNLDPRYNEDKISFLGMWRSIDTNYFKVHDYYGTNFPNDPFEEDIMKFLDERLKAPSLCKNEGEKAEKMEIPSWERHSG